MGLHVGVLAAALLCLGAAPGALATPPVVGFVNPQTTILGFSSAGFSGVAVADLDGDGSDDLVFGADASSEAIMIVGRRADQSIGINQTIFLPGGAGIAQILAPNIAGVPHVLAVMKDGNVYDFSGWPLQQVREFPIATNAIAAAIGDLYSDGHDALVVMNDAKLYAYALDSGMPLWNHQLPNATDAFVLAQLDADPALEIVLGSGFVLDSATFATDSTFGVGYASPVAAGHLLGDGTTQFVASVDNTSITVFRGAPWQSLWSTPVNSDGVGVLATANLDDNGRDVILASDPSYNGVIHGIDSQTHEDRFQIPYSGDSLVAMATMNLGGITSPSLALVTHFYSPTTAVEIVDIHTGDVLWSFSPQVGNFAPVVIGDVDGDGREELVVANNSSDSVQSGPAAVFDFASGALKWRATPNSGNGNDPFYISPKRILLSPHGVGMPDSIAFVGVSSYDGRITEVDGKTHAVTLEIYQYATGPLKDRYVEDALLVDYDNDGVQDFALATQGSLSDSSGATIMVFSGLDGHLMWTSDPIGTANTQIHSVMVTGPATNPASQLIALTDTGIYAFNIASGAAAGHFLATADGATFIPTGAAGAEIATFSHSGGVTFYGAGAQNYLRSFPLPEPINAILPLGGDARSLLVSAGGKLIVVDGITGSVLSSSELKYGNLGIGNQLAAASQGGSRWHVAAGNDFGSFRYDLDLRPDDVFADGFGD